MNPAKRKCTRADPAQTRILLKNYDAEERPSAEQFVGMSQETNLCVALIPLAPLSDTVVCPFHCTSVYSLPYSLDQKSR